MATIKPIEGRSVHQIQSGQVIVDLCSVVKELVENSLDAGATSIDVRFRNNGLDSIEVQDNGSGIGPEDYETIALKHYTSKLFSYDDLTSLQTFGFRGEALSSLCALSKFHILTARATEAPKGTRLDFEVSGKLKGTSVVASQKGTTVVVENLFQNLPVRRKELEKNIKREYGKVLGLLHAYACISTEVHFAVSNQMPKGKKVVAFSTKSNPTTKENIANVYGAKTLSALIPLDLKFEMDPGTRSTQSARNWSTQEDQFSGEVKILGHISRPVVGEGRQTPDRQMFFVNSRPCGLPQVAKAFNEVYKSYNITQSPFIFANIQLDTNSYDVNVSPDKRTILLHDQTKLLENLKTSLIKLFEGHEQSVPESQLSLRKLPAYKPLTSSRERGSIIEPAEDSRSKSFPVQDEPQSDIQQPSSSTPSGEILDKDGGRPSLIQQFVGRNAEGRVERSSSNVRHDAISTKKEMQAKPLHGVIEQSNEDIEMADHPSESSSPTPMPAELPKPVQDFNARIASQHAKEMALEPSSSSSSDMEETIPAIKQTLQKPPKSSIQNAFDLMRPTRTPTQKATITIGDTTTVSTIGSGSRKRPKIHTPKFGLHGTPLSQNSNPLLSKSLRAFAAPGTQIGSDDDDADSELDDEPSSNMPHAPAEAESPLFEPSKSPSTAQTYQELEEHTIEGPEADGGVEIQDDTSVDAEADVNHNTNHEEDSSDEEFVDESEKKAREEAKVAQLIADAEATAALPTEDNLKRATKILKGPRKKYSTLELVHSVDVTPEAISRLVDRLESGTEQLRSRPTYEDALSTTFSATTSPEERLSLTVSKSDFTNMRIIGQFNLGFILAVRPSSSASASSDLFIIDQHASDEKYNFERLSSSTILVSQRLVHPHALSLTAIEEEIILTNNNALTANGFIVSMDTSGESAVGSRARLLSLPMSKEVTFKPTDLEELLALLVEHGPTSTTNSESSIPRPSKVRKLLASRACRGSVMVGKTLTVNQMEKVVRHMGEMDKPWSCPHGRPTMRHLFGLDKWSSWEEGSGLAGLGEAAESRTDWGSYAKRMRRES